MDLWKQFYIGDTLTGPIKSAIYLTLAPSLANTEQLEKFLEPCEE